MAHAAGSSAKGGGAEAALRLKRHFLDSLAEQARHQSYPRWAAPPTPPPPRNRLDLLC